MLVDLCPPQIGSDDASYQNLIALTRQARESIGFGPHESSASESQDSTGRQMELGSAFELRKSEDEYHGDRNGDVSMAFDQSENFDDLVLVSSEEKEAEGVAEGIEKDVFVLGVEGETEGDMSVFIEPAEQSEILNRSVISFLKLQTVAD